MYLLKFFGGLEPFFQERFQKSHPLFYEVVSEAVDLVSEIDELHSSLVVVGCCGVIELNASALKVVNGAVNVCCLDSDVTVCAGTLVVHNLKLGANEDRLGSNLGAKGEVVTENLCGTLGCCSARIDTNVTELETEHCVNSLANESLDAVEIAGGNHFGMTSTASVLTA